MPEQAKNKSQQRFTVSHYNDSDFKRDGLRPFFEYRDLGLAEVTGGTVQAHVNRAAIPGAPGEWHRHDVEFQFVYLLRGWLRCEFEGHGAVTMRAGSAWIQPPNIKHIVHEYSDDFESLEIILPAGFKTYPVDYPDRS